MTTYHLELYGSVAAMCTGLALLLALVIRWVAPRLGWVEAPVYVARHRGDGTGGGNVEELHAWPAGRPEEAKPVRHVGAEAEQGQIGTVAPEVSEEMADMLTTREAAIAAVWDDAHAENELRDLGDSVGAALARLREAGQDRIDAWLRDGGKLPGLVEARRAAFPHCDDPTGEIRRPARAGAR